MAAATLKVSAEVVVVVVFKAVLKGFMEVIGGVVLTKSHGKPFLNPDLTFCFACCSFFFSFFFCIIATGSAGWEVVLVAKPEAVFVGKL